MPKIQRAAEAADDVQTGRGGILSTGAWWIRGYCSYGSLGTHRKEIPFPEHQPLSCPAWQQQTLKDKGVLKKKKKK